MVAQYQTPIIWLSDGGAALKGSIDASNTQCRYFSRTRAETLPS